MGWLDYLFWKPACNLLLKLVLLVIQMCSFSPLHSITACIHLGTSLIRALSGFSIILANVLIKTFLSFPPFFSLNFFPLNSSAFEEFLCNNTLQLTKQYEIRVLHQKNTWILGFENYPNVGSTLVKIIRPTFIHSQHLL